MDEYIELFKNKKYTIKDLVISSFKIILVYNEVLCDVNNINNYILNKLLFLNYKQLKDLYKYLPICNLEEISFKQSFFYLDNGYVLIITDKLYVCEVKKRLDRGVGVCQSELSLMGPKDCFTESFIINLGLIKRRIKKGLIYKDYYIGRYTNTRVSILYIDGIVKGNLINHIEKCLYKIDIDGILDSSYLKNSLENNCSLFPTIMLTERPDKACMALLEGKAVIIVDTSPYVLILPSLFLDFFHTTDDYFQKSFNVTFIRFIRFFAFFIAIFTPGVYLSVTTRNYDLIPFSLLLMLKAGRSYVPFPAPIEALFMILCFEILKESDIRMSTTSGSAISILGGLILGDAAVAAGIVSPIMIIVIAISSIAGLIFPSIELGNALRTYKILILLLASCLGIRGVILGGLLLFYNLWFTNIFGYSYFSIDKNELKDSIVKINSKIRKRNSFLSDNIIRGRFK